MSTLGLPKKPMADTLSALKMSAKNPTRDARDVERFAPAKPPPAGASFIRDLPDRSSAQLTTVPPGAQASEIQAELEAPEIFVPEHWSKGALLNVRNRGDCYVITLYPEEADPRHPERMMMFPNTWTCQDFVSRWYRRETADPRARG